MKNSDDLLRIENISKIFGKNVVLRNLFLEVKKGELLGIIGGSGVGKTTLLNCMIGFLEADEGDVFYNYKGQEYSIYKNPIKFKSKVGFSSQVPSYYGKLTVLENLKLFGTLHNLKKDVIIKKARELLNLTELEDSEKTLAENLSEGMKKRLDIACSLMHNPELLILDEPTASLDPVLTKHIWQIIKKINDAGVTIILSSHFLRDMEVYCDRIAILMNGSIINIGTPEQLSALHSKNHEIHIETHPGNYHKLLEKISKDKFLKKVIKKDNKIIIYTPAAEVLLYKILKVLNEIQEHLINLEVVKPSLSEIFEDLQEVSKK